VPIENPASTVLIECEVVQQRLEIGRERVVVEPRRRLARFAEPAPVVGDAAVSIREQHSLLALPGVAVKRVAVDQDNRLAGPVVVVVDLDVGGVLRSDFDEWHGAFLSRL
jgi:hypothetical protein